MSSELFIGNDNDVLITNVRKASDDSAVTDAVMTFTVYDSTGTAVADADSLAMSVINTNDYIGVIPGTINLIAGQPYTVRVVASNYNLRWEKIFIAVVRTFSD